MKRNKKHNAIQAKQESQHQRNLFYRKIQHTMALIGDAKAFHLLDKIMLETLYQCRIHPHKIIALNNQQNRAGQDTGYHDYNYVQVPKIANEIAHLLSFFQRG